MKVLVNCKERWILAFMIYGVTLSSFSQSMAPRPVIEGYGNRDGDYDIISKDPMRVAQVTCSWYAREGNGTYLYTPPTPSQGNPANWQESFPHTYTFKCALPPANPGDDPAIWKPCCLMSWGRAPSTHETNKPQHCAQTVANPINISLGDKIQTETDIALQDHSPLTFVRYYSSGSSGGQVTGGFGFSWSHTYDRKIIAGSITDKNNPSIAFWRRSNRGAGWVPVSEYLEDQVLPISSFDYAYVVRANGKSLYHYRSDQKWETDYGVASQLTTLPDDSGWLFITKDNTRETYDNQGRLISLETTTGHTESLLYDLPIVEGGDDNPQTLDRVVDQNGNALAFVYNMEGRIQNIIHSNQDVLSYNYLTDGWLASIEYADNTSRQYHYDGNRRLTGITDQRGIRYVNWQYDRSGKAIVSEKANGQDRFTIDYAMPLSFLNVNGSRGSVTVTNPLNKQTTYHFNSWQGTAQLLQVEGHPSTNCAGANKAYTYDANGFMASKTDWQGNVTTYVHNDRGQETSRTEASGTPQARTITTEWHSEFNLPVRISEPERETIMTYDANGRLLNRLVNDTRSP